MWSIDKDTLSAFVEELKGGAGAAAAPDAVNLGAASGAATPPC